MQRRAFLIVSSLMSVVGLAVAQTTPAPSPARRSGRPPLEADSFDIGVYENKMTEAGRRLEFVSSSRDVVAKVGVFFGFSWRLKGYTGTRLVPIRTVVKHPPIKRGSAEPTTLIEDKTFFPPVNGVMERPFLYRFDNEADLVAGEWTLAIYYDDQLIAEHSFTVKPS